MTRDNILIGFPIVLIVAYPFAMRFLARAVQPKRLEMAKLGAILIEHEAFALEYKKTVLSMMKDAFDPLIAVRMASMFPVFIIWNVLLRRYTRTSSLIQPEMLPLFKKFILLFMLSIFAANPIFGIICGFELIVVVILMLVRHVFTSTSLGILVAISALLLSFAQSEEQKRSHGFRGVAHHS